MLLPIVDDGTFIMFPDMFAIFVDRMEFHNGHRCMKGPGSRNLPLLVVADLSDVCLRAGSCWRSDAPTVLKWRAVVTRRKRRAVLSDASGRRLLAHLQGLVVRSAKCARNCVVFETRRLRVTSAPYYSQPTPPRILLPVGSR
jgi:hypothetical protein